MNKDNAKDYLPFIIALSEGKEVQWSCNLDTWKTVPEISFSAPPSYYRIKPEPVILKTRRYIANSMFDNTPFVGVLRYEHVLDAAKFQEDIGEHFIRWIDIAWVETEV